VIGPGEGAKPREVLASPIGSRPKEKINRDELDQ